MADQIRVNTDRLKADTKDIKDHIDGLKNSVKKLREHTGPMKDFIEGLEEEIDKLETGIETLEAMNDYEAYAVSRYDECEAKTSDLMKRIKVD